MSIEPQHAPLQRSRARRATPGWAMAWMGALAGAALSTTAFLSFTGLHAGSRLGWLGDILLTLLPGLVMAVLIGLAVWGLILLARVLPPLPAAATVGIVGAAVGFLAVEAGPAAALALLFVLPGTLLGAALGLERQRGLRSLPVILSLAGALLVMGGSLWLLLSPGTDRHLAALPPSEANIARALDLPNPGAPGSYPVKHLTYGSGTDQHRPEYGPDVTIKTPTVDGSPFFGSWTGWRGSLRTWHWGFDSQSLPLNGRVWYPDGEGPFPLVLILHGNHNMTDYSDPGYAYLGELLASRGYIAVSVDQNFINGGFPGDLGGYATSGRAWLLLRHLLQWRLWQEEPGHPFAGLADMEKIALIGHSRGGEAAYLAALFNRLERFPDNASVSLGYQFGIRTVIAIAPADGQYTPAGKPTPGADFNYLVLHGAHDGDVNAFAGTKAYQRLTFSGERYYAKASVYIHGANHNQFNTVWGRRDVPAPLQAIANVRPLMPATEQRQAAQVFIGAFLEATLGAQPHYLELFRDHRSGAQWLPPTRYITRFADSTQLTLANFEEDVDVTTATLPGAAISASGLSFWNEQALNLRKGSPGHTNMALLRWRGMAHYRLQMPEQLPPPWQSAGRGAALTLDLADLRSSDEASEGPLDLTVALVQRDGQVARLPLSQFQPLSPPLPVKLYKLGPLEQRLLGEPGATFQTFTLSLDAFAPGLTPALVEAVRLEFDRAPSGAIAIDEIGFRR